jgi:acyl-[acyl-carrier-protein]-phospholipid O-acyltransferase/long-chain-fatty-acid--[acyl-carrier-protein] ligase
MADTVPSQTAINGETSAPITKGTGYRALLAEWPFQAFLWTQFLGALNDNIYKMIVSVMAIRLAGGANSGRYLAIAGAVFVIPFLIFAGYAGQLADRFSKTRVLQITKSLEVVTMLMGILALVSGRLDLLLVVLFLLATQANFFSPAKYGILPEMMTEGNLSRANGLLELTTFIAIVAGSSLGTLLYERWQGRPVAMGSLLLLMALIGTAASLGIRYVPAAGANEAFHWNPFHEIAEGTRTLIKQRSLALSVLGISWFWFVGALFQLALLLSAAETLHISQGDSGFLIMALSAGIGLGSVAAGALSGDHIELGLVPAGSFAMGLCCLFLGATTNYHAALAWLTGIGFTGGLFVVPLNAWLQEKAGVHEKGRIMATNNFANMVGVIAASGTLWLLHDVLGWSPSAIFVALGLAILAGGVGAFALLPAITVRFMLWCLTTSLLRVHVEGAERVPRKGGALMVSNHVSYADAALVGMTTPRIVRFLVWAPFYRIRATRAFFLIFQAIPVNPGSAKMVVNALKKARTELERGKLVGIFPEGSITRSGEIEPFTRGFGRIVDGTGLPLIPVHIEGMFGHPLSCKGGSAMKSWERWWRPEITVRVGEPIYTPIAPEELRQVVLELGSGSTME